MNHIEAVARMSREEMTKHVQCLHGSDDDVDSFAKKQQRRCIFCLVWVMLGERNTYGRLTVNPVVN